METNNNKEGGEKALIFLVGYDFGRSNNDINS